MCEARDRELVATGRGGRLVDVLHLRGRLSVHDAAALLACGERNVYRVVATLSAAGVPVTLEAGWIVLIRRDFAAGS